MSSRPFVALTIVALVACESPRTPPPDTSSAAPPAVQEPAPAVTAAAAPAVFRVRLETSKGPIVIEARREWAPNGVDRIFELVESGYFDDVRFFRVVPGFVVQFGIHGDPATDAQWKDRVIPDDPVKQTNRRGTVTFATAGPGTRTTQLFINLGDNAFLDGQGFSPVGEVVEGMGAVDALYSAYGDTPTGQQQAMHAEGNAFLRRQFPRLDYIRTARLVK